MKTRLLLSVAPEVKVIRAGAAPTARPTSYLACASAAAACRPGRCALEALAGLEIHGIMTSTTSGAAGVEAL